MPVFDKELLASLNEAYRSRPYVPATEIGTYDPEGQRRSAEQQAGYLSLSGRAVEVEGKRVLELGCGRGALSALLSERAESVVGVDLKVCPEWDELRGRHANLTFLAQDIVERNPFPGNEFDLIVSFVAFEHIRHPYSMLRACYDMLKPGGRFVLHANLYPSAMASHTYGGIFFPYVHLLFSEDVICEYLRETGERGQYQPVNCLTMAHYEKYFDLIGFKKVEDLVLMTRPLDEEFLARFADRLERWPRFDLALDFFAAYLRKPTHPAELGQAFWDLGDAEEANRWRVTSHRGRARHRALKEGLAVRAKASPGPAALCVHRELGMAFVGEPRLGIECRVTGWHGATELLAGIMAEGTFHHFRAPIEPDETVTVEAPHNVVRAARSLETGRIPAKALLRFVLRGELSRGHNELLIKRVWI